MFYTTPGWTNYYRGLYYLIKNWGWWNIASVCISQNGNPYRPTSRGWLRVLNTALMLLPFRADQYTHRDHFTGWKMCSCIHWMHTLFDSPRIVGVDSSTVWTIALHTCPWNTYISLWNAYRGRGDYPSVLLCPIITKILLTEFKEWDLMRSHFEWDLYNGILMKNYN